MMLLTSVGIISRTIGILFRIYMSNRIGAEGIGLFQLISTVYLFCATLTTSGMSLAVTRLVTECIAKNSRCKIRSILKRCILISSILSIITGTALFSFAPYIGQFIIKDMRTILPLKILSVSIPFMAMSSCFRGYFFAVREVIKTASEQLLEQLIEIGIFAAIAGYLIPKGIEYACCAIVIGTTVAEVVSLFYSFLLYYADVQKFEMCCGPDKKIYRNILKISLPITASSCLRSGLNTLENILITQGLIKFGSSVQASLSTYGTLSGMVMPILSFPASVLFAFSSLLIPELSESYAAKHNKSISHVVSKVFQITLLFSFFISGIFIFHAKEISFCIYKSNTPGIYLGILAPLVPLMYLDSVVDGMLKGLNQQMYNLSYNIIDSIFSIVCIYLFLPIKGIYALMVIICASTLLNAVMSISRLIKVASPNVSFLNFILSPILSISVPCLIVKYVSNCFSVSENYFSLGFKIILIAISYITLLFISGSIQKSNLVIILRKEKRGV